MKRILLVAALLLGACASEEPTMAEATQEALTGAAGSGSSLLAVNQCNRTLSNWETVARGKLGVYHGDGWSWTGALNGSWSGNKSAGGGTSHFACALVGTDSLTGVRRSCKLTAFNGAVFNYDYRCSVGGGMGSPIPANEICTETSAGQGTVTVYSSNPCN